MVTLSLQRPDSLNEQLKAVAEREGVSIDQFIARVVAEKLSALTTVDDLAECAGRGDRARFDRVLARVRAVPAEGDDRLPEDEDDGLDMKQVGALVEAAMKEDDADDPLLESYRG